MTGTAVDPTMSSRTQRASPAGLGAVVLGAAFHYLGPSFAVLLFVHVDALGVAWLRLAQVASGSERTHAYARVHELNPLEEALPGEDAPAPG